MTAVTTFLLVCPVCTTKNRIRLVTGERSRCGKCKHVFTPADLVKAVPEVPVRTASNFALSDDDDPTHACKDEEDCGWEGAEDELDEGDNGKPCCPDCGKRVRRIDDN